MASAAGVAGVRATLDLGSKSSKCVQCGEPDSARITRYSESGMAKPTVRTHHKRGKLGADWRKKSNGGRSAAPET